MLLHDTPYIIELSFVFHRIAASKALMRYLAVSSRGVCTLDSSNIGRS